MPMLRLLMPLITGIILHYHFEISGFFIFILCLTFFLLLCISKLSGEITGRYSFRWLFGFLLNGFILTFAICLMARTSRPPSYLDYISSDGHIIARITESPEERENRIRIILEALASAKGDSIITTSGRLVAWLEKDSLAATLRIGDHLVIPGDIKEISNSGNPFEFNYKNYLALRRIYGEIFLSGGQWYIHDSPGLDNILLVAGRAREYLLSVLRKYGIDGKEFAVAGALILGYRDALDPVTRESYAASGAMHILAVSGLHVGIIYLLVYRLTGIFNRFKYTRVTRPVAIIITLWIYALITGLSPSVTRSATMFSFVAAAGSFGKSTNTFNTLASSAFIQLLINPCNLFMVGFQLSYAAVAGIAYYHPVIFSLIKFRNSLAEKIWTLSSVSISAQLIVFPLVIYYFNQFPNYFLLTNLLAIPLAMVILYLSITLFAVSFFPFVPDIIGLLLDKTVSLLNYITTVIGGLPLSHSSDLVISLISLFILYGIVLSLSHYLLYRQVILLKVTFLLCITGLTIRTANIINTSGQEIFIVYNSWPDSMYSFVSGKKNFIYSGSNQQTGELLIPYAAHNAALHLGTSDVLILQELRMIATETNNNTNTFNSAITGTGNFILFSGLRIYFAGNEHLHLAQSGLHIEVDILVISGGVQHDIRLLAERIVPGKIVIDSSVGYYQGVRLTEQCRELGINYHDVQTSGAFVMHITN